MKMAHGRRGKERIWADKLFLVLRNCESRSHPCNQCAILYLEWSTNDENKAKTVDGYLATLDDDKRAASNKLRKIIESVTPKTPVWVTIQKR